MMWLELIPVIISLVAVCVAVFTDLKDRIISDKLTYPLIVIGIGFSLLVGIYRGEWFRALYGGLGAGLAFGIGYVMYRTGGWAGGDVKLFTGLGALLPAYEVPFDLPYSTFFAPYAVSYPLFPLTILFNSIIVAVPVLLLIVGISRVRGQGAFYSTVKISELEEGVIPAEIIYEKDDEATRYDTGYLGFLSRRIGTPDWDKKITDPDRAAGVTEEQIETLQELVEEGELEDRIKTKKGIPFAPALGAGAIIGIFYGSLYWRLIIWLVTF